MNKLMRWLLLVMLCVGAPVGATQTWASDPAGSCDPSLYSRSKFPVPKLSGSESYLGLAEGVKDFTLSDIRAEVVVVEVFSMDCPKCQRSAKKYNELYAMLRDKGLTDKIKMVGIGIGNTDLEVGLFQKKHAVVFPLAADPESRSYYMVGRVHLPYLMILQRDGQGGLKNIYSKEKEPRDAKQLLAHILSISGM